MQRFIDELQRLGITLKAKALGQHVSNLIDADLKRCGIKLPFGRILGEGIFVNALTGRQPACLPELGNADYSPDGEHTDREGERSVREICLNPISQAIAVAKLDRAVKAKTR